MFVWYFLASSFMIASLPFSAFVRSLSISLTFTRLLFSLWFKPLQYYYFICLWDTSIFLPIATETVSIRFHGMQISHRICHFKSQFMLIKAQTHWSKAVGNDTAGLNVPIFEPDPTKFFCTARFQLEMTTGPTNALYPPFDSIVWCHDLIGKFFSLTLLAKYSPFTFTTFTMLPTGLWSTHK